jgi:predicted transcriptional regulator
MTTQVNIRLPEELRRKAESYAKRHGFGNIQELAREALRSRIMEEESIKETLEVLKDRKLMASLSRSRKDIEEGRVRTWEELRKSWKKAHGRK